MKISRYNQLIEKDNYLILFNSISNAILYVEPNKVKEVKEVLESGNIEEIKLSDEDIEKLKKGLYIIPDEFDEITYEVKQLQIQ